MLVTVDNGGNIVDVGPLQLANRLTVDLTGSNTTIIVGGFNGLDQINDSMVEVTVGAVIQRISHYEQRLRQRVLSQRHSTGQSPPMRS